MRSFIHLLCAVCLIVVCANSAEERATAAQGRKTAAKPQVPEDDVIAFASGALVVQEPDPDSQHHASWLLRGKYETENVWEINGPPNNRFVVIELPERSLVKQLEFDTAMVVGGSARDVAVEMSDTSAAGGFTKIADVSLQDRVDDQVFPVRAEFPGRWLRLTIRSSHSPDYAGICRFRARGVRLTTTPFPNVSGSYMTRNGAMHIRQEGTSVVGCYEEREGIVYGGIEGRVMKLTWRENVAENNEGAAFMVFSGDGRRWAGLFSYKGEDPNVGRFWTGTKLGTDIGTCPHWSGGMEQQLTREIEQFGRARVYGINFDTDSDRIREESKETLNQVVSVLKARPEWNIALEGHTDSTGSSQHNQELSLRRANSVKQYLVTAGVTAARLGTAGHGASKPVASNDNVLGRAQNRRVELVKQ
jgi:hypothetical protein